MPVPGGAVRDLDGDLVVVGGGVAGVCAAIAAARQGLRTVLVQDRPVFGGNSSSEIRVVPAGAAMSNAWSAETGLVHEIMLTDRATNYETYTDQGMINSHYDLVLAEFVRRQDGLVSLLNTSVRTVEPDPGDARRIAAVRASQLGSEAEYRVTGRYFVDATGDGTVAAAAGAEFRYGREARSEFGEHLAPVTADHSTLGSTITMKARDVGRDVPFVAPPWAAEYRSADDLGVDRRVSIAGGAFGGYWWLEVNDPFHQIDDNAAIRDELHRHVLGVWDYLKNHSPQRDELRRFALEWIGQLPGKRESRRVAGDVLLTEHDVRQDRHWPDAIGYAGWWIDLHVPGGVNRKAEPAERENVDAHYQAFVRVAPFSVPLRAHLSRSLDNLWLAGRCISASHVGLGPIRVQLALGALGEAVGIAAAHAWRAGRTTHEFASPQRGHLGALQQDLLRHDVRLLGVRNEDPADLARVARVTASSSAALRLDPSDGVDWPALDAGRAQVLPLVSGRVDAVELRLRNGSERRCTVRVGIEPVGTIWQREPGTPAWSGTVTVPAGFDGWLPVPVGADLAPGTYRLTLTGGAGAVAWAAAPLTETGCLAQFLVSSPGGAQHRSRRFASLATDEVDLPAFTLWQEHRRRGHLVRTRPQQQPYGPENVTNGWAWPGAAPNLWRSDPAAAGRPWLQLSWPAPVEAGRVHVSFDTDLTWPTGLRPGLHRAAVCVRDWRLLGLAGGRWSELHAEQGNFLRHRVARFAPATVEALRLEVDATNGAAAAHVYEVRAYPA